MFSVCVGQLFFFLHLFPNVIICTAELFIEPGQAPRSKVRQLCPIEDLNPQPSRKKPRFLNPLTPHFRPQEHRTTDRIWGPVLSRVSPWRRSAVQSAWRGGSGFETAFPPSRRTAEVTHPPRSGALVHTKTGHGRGPPGAAL